jgi:hypothetical protein
MSDKTREILAGINTRLATYTASGQALEDIKSYFVKYTETELPPESLSQPPVLMVDPLPYTPELSSIPPCAYRKALPVRFQLFTENAGDTTRTSAAVILDAIEDTFFQQKLGISNIIVDVTEKNYTAPSSPPFEWPVHGGGSLTITYTYDDIRELPT